MKTYNVEQGADEWFKVRSGIPTASEFDKLLTSTGKPSTQIEGYINLKVAEVLAGQNVETWTGNQWTERGHELEPMAASMYGLINECEPIEVGFVTDDERTCGCSPDRLINDDGLLEIKCPAPQNHVGYLLGGKCPTTYYLQIQGQLMITGRQWCDFMSYHPLLDPLILRVKRDESIIDALRERIEYFNNEVADRVKQIKG
jgi:hypothetical protein